MSSKKTKATLKTAAQKVAIPKIIYLDEGDSYRQKVNLMMGIPSRGAVSITWTLNLLMITPPQNFATAWHFSLGRTVAEARNQIVEDLLKSESEYLFFVDDDVLVPPDSLAKLWYQRDKGIISGLYYTKGDPSYPLIYRDFGSGAFLDWDIGDIVEVGGCGMGCALIHRDVFENIERPWFKTPSEAMFDPETGNWTKLTGTEDLYFCDKAVKAGYKLFVDTSIFCGHIDTNRLIVFPYGYKDILKEARKRKVINTSFIDAG